MMFAQTPLFLLLGALAYLFPVPAGVIAASSVSWVVWQRQR